MNLKTDVEILEDLIDQFLSHTTPVRREMFDALTCGQTSMTAIGRKHGLNQRQASHEKFSLLADLHRYLESHGVPVPPLKPATATEKTNKGGRPKVQVSPRQVAEIRLLYHCGLGQTDLGTMYGISPYTVHDIVTRKTYSTPEHREQFAQMIYDRSHRKKSRKTVYIPVEPQKGS